MTSFRYGFYLRPDLATSRAQLAIHDLLRAQYNLHAAGKFMPHATLKGFFRSDSSPDQMIERLDMALAGVRSFTAYNNGVLRFGPRSIVIGLKFSPDGTPNHTLYDLQERAWAALEPLIHPECEFTPRDPRGLAGSNPFHPHLTLAMADLPPALHDEVFEFVTADGPIGPPQFEAQVVQLFRFRSEDWAGAWWETLQWEWIRSWWLAVE